MLTCHFPLEMTHVEVYRLLQWFDKPELSLLSGDTVLC